MATQNRLRQLMSTPMNHRRTLFLEFARDFMPARVKRHNRIQMSFVAMQAPFVPKLHPLCNRLGIQDPRATGKEVQISRSIREKSFLIIMAPAGIPLTCPRLQLFPAPPAALHTASGQAGANPAANGTQSLRIRRWKSVPERTSPADLVAERFG